MALNYPVDHGRNFFERRRPAPIGAIAAITLGVLALLVGSFIGLFVAPAEHYMGDTQRIMYIHVPTAWSAMLVLTWAFACALMVLFRGGWQWDCRLDAAIEVAIVLCVLLCMQGSIWAKPTWGVWWDWDPRLTTVAVLLSAFAGIAALRRFVDDPVRRATWSSGATVIGYIDVPIVYFSVRWWNSLHQSQSSLATVSREFYTPLFVNGAGMLLLVSGVLALRSRYAAALLKEQIAPPPLGTTEPVAIGGTA
jgi:heme exporter protein C